MIERFNSRDYKFRCRQVAAKDKDLQQILANYGYPPYWVRPNTFATLVLTILEQQVSLASAYAAFQKLKQKTSIISPATILPLTDEELRSCYFSRQKMLYVRELASAILNKKISLKELEHQPDEEVRIALKQLKGIGDWTVDIYLLHALRRVNVFPTGDLALVNAMKAVKNLPVATTKEELIQIAQSWQPYRSFATLLLWHYYIKKRGIKIVH